MKKFFSIYGPPLILLFLAVFMIETAARMNWIPAYILPAPSDVLRSLMDDRAELFAATSSTAFAATLGLIMSFILGTLIAILLSASKWTRRALYPYAVFFQTVPIIAVAPILVIWFGFGMPTVLASAFIVSLFPMIASALLGLQSTDPALVDLFHLYSARPFAFLWKLKLPFALPQIFSGLRIASGLAVVGAIVGEFIGGGGLGSVVDVARTQQRIDKVFSAVLLSSLLGLVLVSIVNLLSWLALRRWHVSESKGVR
jgi:NitT/TauT family transport system permease protein